MFGYKIIKKKQHKKLINDLILLAEKNNDLSSSLIKFVNVVLPMLTEFGIMKKEVERVSNLISNCLKNNNTKLDIRYLEELRQILLKLS